MDTVVLQRQSRLGEDGPHLHHFLCPNAADAKESNERLPHMYASGSLGIAGADNPRPGLVLCSSDGLIFLRAAKKNTHRVQLPLFELLILSN
jgi:hypothetical protein